MNRAGSASRVVLITGSAGLVGSEAARAFAREGFRVVGIDNDMRAAFFGPEASTARVASKLVEELADYEHHGIDIRDLESLDRVFAEHATALTAIVHAAAQPSHDWAAREPLTDFAVNAQATANLLELTRQHAPEATFLFTSTNKVYGDSPNRLPFVEGESRWEIREGHRYHFGIDESMSIDRSQHSLFGASKLAADVLVQEYGRYFGLSTVVFRAGCLTGSNHAASEQHGFLAYLMKCALEKTPYRVFGFGGKQVRDNLHASDLANCFLATLATPRVGEVYNVGGGRRSNCSVLEAVRMCEQVTGNAMRIDQLEEPRRGDHRWWVTDMRRFESHYPDWSPGYDLDGILEELYDGLRRRA